MGDFGGTLTSFPTAIYTTLLGVVLLYWLLALFGLVDFENTGPDLDLDLELDADGVEVGSLAQRMVAFGLGGVPFSVVVSLLVLIAWTLSSLAAMWVLPLLPGILALAAGAVVLVLAAVVAIPFTAIAIRPLRGLFVTHGAVRNAALVGQTCKIVTGTVSETFGRAEVARRGASYNIRVVADTPNTLVRGATAMIIDYDPDSARYRVQAIE
ncbi:OB-fold-containig protein [Pseudothauera lacus]|uniref:Ubiquinone biosynthesis protein n=1 Tax=Pseudothauera lacus TaxID=2136175 RepID=A0A2T4IK03_9RHOO|nr:OB-fold-containig protein [Pseudothauera lacus]PTD98080.1 ubiquinone biosynthesis protein [Pseudothauera lacus]